MAYDYNKERQEAIDAGNRALQSHMEQAKYDLQRFSRELGDVAAYISLDFNTGDFLSFADYFFDGMVADWLVQDRINIARAQVDEAIRRVQNVLGRL